MTRWNTAQPYFPAVQLTPILSSPTPWLSAATVVPAGLTATSVHTGPAWMEIGVPNQSDVSTHIQARATIRSLSDPPLLLFSAFFFFQVPSWNCMIHEGIKGDKHDSIACDGVLFVLFCTSLFYCAFVTQHVCAASQFTTGGGGVWSWCIFLSASLFNFLYARVCDSQTCVDSEGDSLNATQLKQQSLNSSLTKLCLT